MLKSNFKDLETHLKNCISKSSLRIETAMSTAIDAAEGAALSVFFDCDPSICSSFNVPPPTVVPLKTICLPGRRLTRAAIMRLYVMGAAGGITCLVKRLRGKDDVDIQTTLVAGFGAAVLFSLIHGVQGAGIITFGVSFALANGGLFKVKEEILKARAKDVLLYSNTRCMLHKLGLDQYERNFKKGLLTDKNLQWLNNSVLEEVKIPPGARDLILDHVESEEMSPLQNFNETKSRLDADKYFKNFKRELITDECLPLIRDGDLQEVEIPAGARHLILNHIKKGEKEVK